MKASTSTNYQYRALIDSEEHVTYGKRYLRTPPGHHFLPDVQKRTDISEIQLLPTTNGKANASTLVKFRFKAHVQIKRVSIIKSDRADLTSSNRLFK